MPPKLPLQILDNPVLNWISGLDYYQVRSNIQIKNNLLLLLHFSDRECYDTNNHKERTQFEALINTEQDLQTFLLSSPQRSYLVYVRAGVVPLLC